MHRIEKRTRLALTPVQQDQRHEGTHCLLLKTQEVCRLLGGIHPRTLHRLEKRGLIRCVPGLLRHKLYSQTDVINLIETLKNWKV